MASNVESSTIGLYSRKIMASTIDYSKWAGREVTDLSKSGLEIAKASLGSAWESSKQIAAYLAKVAIATGAFIKLHTVNAVKASAAFYAANPILCNYLGIGIIASLGGFALGRCLCSHQEKSAPSLTPAV